MSSYNLLTGTSPNDLMTAKPHDKIAAKYSDLDSYLQTLVPIPTVSVMTFADQNHWAIE